MACPNGKITRSQGTNSVDDCIGRLCMCIIVLLNLSVLHMFII